MPEFIIEDFIDTSVLIDVPIEQLPPGVIYDLLLAGDPAAVAYVNEIGVDALIAQQRALTASGDFDESKVERDERGRFTSGGGGDSDAGALAERIETSFDLAAEHGHSPKSAALFQEAKAVGDLVLRPYLLEVEGQSGQSRAVDAKMEVARDLAERIPLDTVTLATALYVPGSITEYTDDVADALGNPDALVYIPEGPGYARIAFDLPQDVVGMRLAEGGAVRGDDPRAESIIREGVTSVLVAEWAETSNDNSPRSLAMQRAVVEEFGLTGTAIWPMDQDTTEQTGFEYERSGEARRAFVRAQYESTQERLAEVGVTEMTLSRGYIFSAPEGPPTPDWARDLRTNDPDIRDVPTRPMSSWSSDFAKATEFGEVLAVRTFPADRILACPVTGIGCLDESEFIVLGDTAPTVLMEY